MEILSLMILILIIIKLTIWILPTAIFTSTSGFWTGFWTYVWSTSKFQTVIKALLAFFILVFGFAFSIILLQVLS